MANPTEEDASIDVPVPLNVAPPVVEINVVIKKAMVDAQIAMKQAKQDHNTAVRVA